MYFHGRNLDLQRPSSLIVVIAGQNKCSLPLPGIIGIYPVKGCYFPLDPQQPVQYRRSYGRMLTKYRLLLQSGRREDDRWRRLVQTEISCLCVRVFVCMCLKVSAGWLAGCPHKPTATSLRCKGPPRCEDLPRRRWEVIHAAELRAKLKST